MLNYQCDVLLMTATFGQQNGAYAYFVDRIERNLRRPQLVCTESEVWIFLKIPDSGRHYIKTLSFPFNVSL